MKTAQDVYDAYTIMPNLQLHQLRVAAVGTTICGSFSGEVDGRCVVLACLFHDMGNIIKADLTVFPDFLEPQGFDYWQKNKEVWIAKYGNDEHVAAKAIAMEIGLPENVIRLIDDTRFSRLEAARDGNSFESKILKYADLRAGPRGVLSLNERLEEGRARYAERKGYDTPEGREMYLRSVAAAQEIERQIFARCSIAPEDIADSSIAPIIDGLRKYEVV